VWIIFAVYVLPLIPNPSSKLSDHEVKSHSAQEEETTICMQVYILTMANCDSVSNCIPIATYVLGVAYVSACSLYIDLATHSMYSNSSANSS